MSSVRELPFVGGTARRIAAGAASARVPEVAEVCLVLELKRQFGGMMARALVGGRFELDLHSELSIELRFSDDPLTLGSQANVPSSFGTALVAGLPSDFSEASFSGLMEGAARSGLPGGRLSVECAAYDEVYSSNRAFHEACAMLVLCIASELFAMDLEETLRGLIATP